MESTTSISIPENPSGFNNMLLTSEKQYFSTLKPILGTKELASSLSTKSVPAINPEIPGVEAFDS